MRGVIFFLTTCIFLGGALTAGAQDTLPKFNVYKKGDGSNFVQWINDYGVVIQITLQRSTDSLKRYASLYTTPNPMAKRGDYPDKDKKTKTYDYYYRLFIQLPEGNYFYTPPQKAVPIPYDLLLGGGIGKDSLGKGLPKVQGGIQPYKAPVFVPSDFIFTDKKGNIIMNLPDAEIKQIKVVFFDELGNELFKINRVKESNLVLEKSNFYRSGWYYFEIYDNEKLVERHKFQVPKEKPEPRGNFR